MHYQSSVSLCVNGVKLAKKSDIVAAGQQFNTGNLYFFIGL